MGRPRHATRSREAAFTNPRISQPLASPHSRHESGKPQATERLVLVDAYLPGIGPWKDVWLMRDLWHFR